MSGKSEFIRSIEFAVSVSIANARVAAIVDLLHEDQFGEATLEFAFYLMRDNIPVWRGSYTSSNRASFLVESAGTYNVKAFVRVGDSKQSRRSKSFIISPRAVEADNFASSQVPKILPFAPLDYPHQDFGLVSASDKTEPLDLLHESLDELGMWAQQWGPDVAPIYAVTTKNNDPKDVVFSGMTRTKDKFIFGQKDLAEVDPCDYLDNVGDFTVAVRHPWGAEISTDYFGVGQLYYYSSSRVTCVSNRYHLLLQLLTAVGEHLTIDRVKARAMLQAVNQPFTQNFSTGMEVAGCKTVRPGNMLRLRGQSLELVETALAQVLAEPTDQEPSSEYYWDEIRSAGDEIVDNLKVALDHTAFSHVRVDLTGGLDARLLFTALSRLQSYEHKVHIHTADVAGSPHDLNISLALTKQAGFNYDTIPRETMPVSSIASVLENISYNLGSYYGIRPESRRSRLPDTLRINGFYGEVSARPYFARLIFGRETEHLAPGDFGHKYVESIGSDELPLGRRDEITSLFRDELDSLPGVTAADKMDVFYLAYRNGLHCSDRWLNHTLAPGWGPLQSKELFELKWRTFNTLKSIKVQVDVTEHLNSELARLPIGRTKDNADRNALDSKYPSSQVKIDSLLHVSDHDYVRYRKAAKTRGSEIRRIPPSDAQIIEIENENFDHVQNETLIRAIKSLEEEYNVLSKSEAETLKRYVTAHVAGVTRPQHRGVVITNKILSLYYQCALVDSEPEQIQA